ncbi:hypothetical protein ACOSQ3_018928 [Xanthoceras sorbifolium]
MEVEECAEVPKEFALDLREPTAQERDGEIEPTKYVVLNENFPKKVVKIGAKLSPKIGEDLIKLLREFKDIFAWSHADMPGINPSTISHGLAVHCDEKPVVQKRQHFNPERNSAIREEVEKRLATRSIRESHYPS